MFIPEGRRSLRDSVRVIAQETTPWLMMGDFNAVRFPNERSVVSSDNWPHCMYDLDSYLCRTGLEDLRFVGQIFTWHNKLRICVSWIGWWLMVVGMIYLVRRRLFSYLLGLSPLPHCGLT